MGKAVRNSLCGPHEGCVRRIWLDVAERTEKSKERRTSEGENKRSVFATATDVRGPWSAPMVLFDTFTQSDHGVNENGEENGPWTILNGRLYTQSGSNDAGEHHEDIISGA